MNAKRILVAALLAFLAVVVLGAVLSSAPIYLVGACGAVVTYLVACVCTDTNEFGR